MIVQFCRRKPEDPHALALKPAIAKSIVPRLTFFGVNWSVDFETQSGGRAVEVEDVDAKRVLTSKAETGEFLAAQQRP